MEAQLDTWAGIVVCGHFTDLEDSPLSQWQLLSEQAAASMSKIVGAAPDEVAAMGTLTMNLHLLLASFYKPTETRRKILMDWKAFPSDHVSAYVSCRLIRGTGGIWRFKAGKAKLTRK